MVRRWDRACLMTLANGVIACGRSSMPPVRAARDPATMAGIKFFIEPRKRFTWIFSAEQPLSQVTAAD
jgi:hypothetical protein